VIDDKLPLDDH